MGGLRMGSLENQVFGRKVDKSWEGRVLDLKRDREGDGRACPLD
jgi:hypothetical protein